MLLTRIGRKDSKQNTNNGQVLKYLLIASGGGLSPWAGTI